MKDRGNEVSGTRLGIRRVAADFGGFDFEAVRKQKSPVILTGATDAWPARRKWSLDYFGEVLGDQEYMAEVGLPEDVPINHSLEHFQRSVRLREFVQSVKKSGSVSYITNKSIDRFPGLENDVDFVRLLGVPVANELVRLWVGGASTKSSLHFDPYENVLCQMIGRKRVYLVDPKYTPCLYQYASNIDKSQVDVEQPDFEAFPRFEGVPVMEDVLNEGEILFIPMTWWHSVRSLEPSISVNCFYGMRAGERELLPMMWSGGPRLVAAFVWDFLWSGVLGRPYRRRLYASEPFGVWFYCQVRDSVARKASRLLGRSPSTLPE